MDSRLRRNESRTHGMNLLMKSSRVINRIRIGRNRIAKGILLLVGIRLERIGGIIWCLLMNIIARNRKRGAVVYVDLCGEGIGFPDCCE